MPVMPTRWVLVALIACGGNKSEPPPAAPDPEIEQFIADMKAYGDKSLPMMMKFDGDCGALADQMLTLEPLAQSILKRGTEIQSSPDGEAKMKLRMRDEKAPMMKHYDDLLKPLGATMADVEKKEAEIKAKCASDARYHEAEERTGIMKKKSKAP